MDIRNIRTFLRAAELRSFTGAARELNYVQSTVTMQIQQLERELGYPLFDRIGKKLSLTALGEEFLVCARQLVHLMDRAATLERDPAQLRGQLRIGILESLLFGHMHTLLPRFREHFPKLEVQLKMGQAPELVSQLKQNLLDMAYLSGDLNTDPDLCCHYRRRERLVFLCGPEHPLAGQNRIPLEILLREDFIVTERSGFCFNRLRQLAARQDTPLRSGLEVDSTAVIARLLPRSRSLAFLPEYSVQSQLARGALISLDADVEEQTYYSQILCHKSRWISPFMERLIADIQEHYPENN